MRQNTELSQLQFANFFRLMAANLSFTQLVTRAEGYSIEEGCPPELWFAEDADGPREWKSPAARSGRCAYGKFFDGKAGFVSPCHSPFDGCINHAV